MPLLAAAAPRHLAGEAAGLPRLLRVRAQRPPPRQSPPQRAPRRPGGVTGCYPAPRIPKRAIVPLRRDPEGLPGRPATGGRGWERPGLARASSVVDVRPVSAPPSRGGLPLRPPAF